MKFAEALKAMKEGQKVKLPSWGGYWAYEEATDSIWMHCKDGTVLELRETDHLSYTLENICSDEWIIADEGNTPILGGVATFHFGEAIKYLRRGMKVARAGWNGKNAYVFLAAEDITFTTDADMSEFLEQEVEVRPMLAMRTEQKTIQPGWLASQADMLADDWMIVE